MVRESLETSSTAAGVFGESANSIGVQGIGHKEPGVNGISDSSDGVKLSVLVGNRALSAVRRRDNGVALVLDSSHAGRCCR